eukprot:1463014-Amphidinium_carterae.1
MCGGQSACANLSNKLLAMLRVASMLRKATPRCERMRSSMRSYGNKLLTHNMRGAGGKKLEPKGLWLHYLFVILKNNKL